MGKLPLKLVMQDDNIKSCNTITNKENKIDKRKGKKYEVHLKQLLVGGYSNTKCQDNNNNTTSYIAKDLNKGEQHKGNHKTTLKNTMQNIMRPHLNFFFFLTYPLLFLLPTICPLLC
jgi:hypothetical protein